MGKGLGAASGAYAGAAAGALITGATGGAGAPVGGLLVAGGAWLGTEVGGWAGGVGYRNVKKVGNFFSRKTKDVGRWVARGVSNLFGGGGGRRSKPPTLEQQFTYPALVVALIDSMEAGHRTLRTHDHGTVPMFRALHKRNLETMFGKALGPHLDPDKVYIHLFTQYQKVSQRAIQTKVPFTKEEKFMLALRSVALFIQEDGGTIREWPAFGREEIVEVTAGQERRKVATVPRFVLQHRSTSIPSWYADPLMWGSVATLSAAGAAVTWYTARRL